MHVTCHEPLTTSTRSHPTAGESQAVAREDTTTHEAYAEAFRFANDTVEISTTARDVQRVEKALRESPEIREHRVASATQAVIGGLLNLDSEALAHSLLSDPFHTAVAFA